MVFASMLAVLAMVLVERSDTLTVARTDEIKLQLPMPSKEAALFPAEIAWFHVPRCGSSFQFNLFSLDGVCKDKSLAVDASTIAKVKGVLDTCPGLMIPENAGPHCKPHIDFGLCAEFTFGAQSLERNGLLMGMFRQPEQRMMSEWYWAMSRDWEIDSKKLGNGTLADFARIRQGCAMRMLINEAGRAGHCSESAPTFEAEERMDEALGVLEKFTFVALTEEWALSMCLFNVMFGTPCRTEQVWDLTQHQTSNKTSDLYDTSELNGWADPYDGPVYERARQTFAHNLAKYDVSEDTCASCFHQMGMS